jgi:hypothetical protein
MIIFHWTKENILNPSPVELQQAQEQSVRLVIREDIMSVVLGLIVIVRKMDTEYYKIESIFLHYTEDMLNYIFR